MGIDVNLIWTGQTDEQIGAQRIDTPPARRGMVGYLREAYHGGPYATCFLLREAFEAWETSRTQTTRGKARIAATMLRERCPDAVALTVLRDVRLYRELRGRDPSTVDECVDPHAHWLVPDVDQGFDGLLALVTLTSGNDGFHDIPSRGLLEEARGAVLLDRARGVPVQALGKDIADFVALVERLEAEGREPLVSVYP